MSLRRASSAGSTPFTCSQIRGTNVSRLPTSALRTPRSRSDASRAAAARSLRKTPSESAHGMSVSSPMTKKSLTPSAFSSAACLNAPDRLACDGVKTHQPAGSLGAPLPEAGPEREGLQRLLRARRLRGCEAAPLEAAARPGDCRRHDLQLLGIAALQDHAVGRRAC